MTSYPVQEQLLPFADNAEFLAMKLKEYLLRLTHTALSQALDQQIGPEENRPAYALYRPVTKYLMEKVAASQQGYRQLRASNNLRLAVSMAADVPAKQVVETHTLDEVEQEVVWMLFFKAVSVAFRREYRETGLFASKSEPDDLLCVGSLVQLLSPVPAVQINLLAYFHPGGRLCRQGLVCLERGASGAGMPALETRLYLDEQVRGRIIGT
ncbi:MAG: hypothetical protein IT369_17090 [Candidatus Latescibacteria bacterium]|nr:hypothetical protein [Candidatus Latescibacterota bacterium]